MNLEIDVRDVVSTVRVPTVVLHRTGDPNVPVKGGRWMAEHIPGARFVEFPGSAHGIPLGDAERVEREIESRRVCEARRRVRQRSPSRS